MAVLHESGDAGSPPGDQVTRGRGVTRRGFLAGAGGAVAGVAAGAAMAAPYIVPASALGAGGATPPSDRIGIGSIGLGSRGTQHLKGLLQADGVEIRAVCDPQQPKCEAARDRAAKAYAGRAQRGSFRGCLATADFREVLDRPDVDAVVIAAPENWHALVAAFAARAGKDIYCEKALSLTVAEGRALVDTVRRTGRILQVGTQQRSGRNFRFACELARNGYLGRLTRVEVGVPGGRALPNVAPEPVPPDIDYDLWLGPAPYTPYNPLKVSFNWYFIYDYCIGWIQSWGVHHVDIALWGAPSLGQGAGLQVEGSAVFPDDGIANTSITWDVRCTTPDGLVLHFTDNRKNPQGCRFIGEKGWVHVTRGGIRAEPASLLTVALGPGAIRLYESNEHHGNWIECMRTRRDPVAPIEAGHAATGLTIVCDIATRLGRKLTWNWPTETFENDPAADRMLSRAMRNPWRL